MTSDPMPPDALEAALAVAHQRGDARALARLYDAAATACENPDAAAFLLTQAHVYALEAGDGRAAALRRRLCDLGREAPLSVPERPPRL